MKRIISTLVLTLVVVSLLSSCNPMAQTTGGASLSIHLNQVGYLPQSYKSAVVHGEATSFTIVDDQSLEVVYKGELGEPKYWEASGETVRLAVFSDLETKGSYKLMINDQASHSFAIASNIYAEVGAAATKAYYFHRAGVALEKQYAGVYARSAGHPDTAVGIHASAASEARPEGTLLSFPKGWYDAGDYGKYIVNSAITVSTMMSFYEHYPTQAQQMITNIPESTNSTPDLLDEVRWNLEWMLSMQDPDDGGVYHKLTTKEFGGMVLPHLDIEPRWVVMKTTPAALVFTASMAQASRIYRPLDSAFADHCLEAARSSWAWAQSNRDVPYLQPEDVQTGTYGQEKQLFDDELYWAAVELSITTGESYEKTLPARLIVPEWRDGAALAIMDLLTYQADETARAAFMALADSLLREQQSSSYDVSNDVFRWGSTSDFLNQAMILIYAHKLTGDISYKEAAQSTFDWVLGKNPTGYSFVTGFGDKTAMHIHHRPSEGDAVVDPQPGWVIGGPNPANKYDCGEDLYVSEYPALAYLDLLCSYATNEIAINWNAPFIYVAHALMEGS